MQKRILPVAVTAIILTSLIGWNCTKLDTTDLGSDLLPAVDNVTTFADTIPVISTQGVFPADETYILRTDDHTFGLNNDPVFGQTTAGIAFQLKPGFYPFYLGAAGDTLVWPTTGSNNCSTCAGVDSVVLCLKYKGVYGDTLTSSPIRVEVHEVVDNMFRDSTNTYKNANYFPTIGSNVGYTSSTPVDVKRLADTVKFKYGTGSTVNTIRIRLSDAYANTLYRRDTAVTGSNNAFRTDSLFRNFYNGLAVVPVPGSGNQLVYTSLSDVSTRIEVHFRRKNLGRVDTLVNTLQLNPDFFGADGNRSSNTANKIQRTRPGLPTGDQEVYLQTAPGTYANISLPALSTRSNRIVHRAELIVQEIPDLSGSVANFPAPNFLYLDLKDTGAISKFKPVYYDLTQSASYDPDYKNPLFTSYFPNAVDFTYYGGYLRTRPVVAGNPATHYYNFNITRYVQDMLTNHKTNYPLRLWAPFNVRYPQYSLFPIAYGNNIAYGRIKVGGGSNANPNYRMIMRVIYSNL